MNTLDRRWLSYYTKFNNILNIQGPRRRHRAPGREKPSWRHDNFMSSNSENNCIRTTNDALGKALTGDTSVVSDVSRKKNELDSPAKTINELLKKISMPIPSPT